MTDSKPTGGELIGKKLGQYEIRDELGQGGMATVYLAHQPSIDRTVAVKVMPMYFLHDPNFVQRFDREVKVIAKLQHPRIVPVYDYGQEDNRPYVVMAYMPGGTLADKVKQGAMPIDEVVRLTTQIAEGLDHAHREGVVHRDFKPSNVLLDKGGNAHLADFGIAKISEQTVALTGSGVVGTPAYMAPEMASEGTVTPAVDIYALGVTLYQMLTGKYPYSGDTPLRVMMAHATEPVPNVRTLRADLAQEVADVIAKAMAKDPADRFPTAGEVAKALKAAVEGRSTAIHQAAARPSDAATILEPQPHISTPPPPAYTPPPPISTPPGSMTPPPAGTPAVGMGYGAPGYVTPGGYTPTPPGVMPTQKKGGCSPVLIVLGSIAGLVVVGSVLFCVLSGAGLTAIGMLAPTSTPQPTWTPFPTITPIPPTDVPVVPTGDESTMVITNRLSGDSICYLYMTESGSNDWGDDQLGDEIIPQGEQFELSSIPPGSYDIKMENCEFDVVYAFFETEFEGGEYTLDVEDPTDIVIVVNETSSGICGLYISHNDWTTWGRNLIESGHDFDSGDRRSIAVWEGTWDFRAELCDDREAERMDNVVEQQFEWTVTD